MRVIVAIVCLLACSANAADDAHLLAPFEGRFVGGLFKSDTGLLWRNQAPRSVQIDLERHGEGLMVAWSMDDGHWSADVTGTIANRFAYRPLDADEFDLDAHCHVAALAPAPEFGIRLSLSCHTHRGALPFTLDIDALLDPATKRPDGRLAVALSIYEPDRGARNLRGIVARATAR